jgi:homoserine O-acetyltransferase
MRFKTLALGVFIPLFAAMPLRAQEIKFAPLGNFRLESGETIRNLQLGYRTLGTLNADRSNVILWPTWFTGTSAQLLSFVGSGKLLDPSKYYVILVDALGDGVTSSPSNSARQPHMYYPRFTIRDMVNAEHQLAVNRLGLRHLRAVMGISMGGMQTFEWVVAYPDFMDKAIPIVGSPRLTSYDLLLWTAEKHAIESDAAWNHGDYASTPVAGMETAADIHSLNLTTPAYRVAHTPPEDFPEFLGKTERDTMKGFDANDWIRQLQAIMAQDVSKPFGGSMEKAAAAVRAKVLVVAATQDHMVNPVPALDFAQLIHAQTLQLTSDCGHLSPGCEESKMKTAIQEFLEK